MNTTFKDRLFAEKEDLDAKRSKLAVFQQSAVFQTIEPFQKSLLEIQAIAMATYSQCLKERIAWLQKKELEQSQ